nr:hypothetical protein [Tanacetum cinerariifolium]
MVINSPCLTDKKELVIPRQMATGKEFLNPLMPDLKSVDQNNMVAYLEKIDDNTAFHQIVDFLSSCSINYAIIAVDISESSVRSDLLFDDEDGGGDSVERAITTDASLVAAQDSDNIIKTQTTTTSNVEIPQGIDISGRPRDDSVERAITTDASLEVPHASDNILRTQTTVMPNVDIPQGMDTCGSPRSQETIGGTFAQTRSERVLEQCVERAITTDASLEVPQASDNILRTQTTVMPNVDIPQGMDTCGSPRSQETIGGTFAQTRSERVLE